MRIDKACFKEYLGCMVLKYKIKQQIVDIAFKSLNDLRTRQAELFENQLAEDTLKYQFIGIFETYLVKELNLSNDYIEYRIDFNYNRTGDNMKYVGVTLGDNRRTLFDTVIHQRGIGNTIFPENLIHFEFKGFNCSPHTIESDKVRLRLTTLGNNDPLIVSKGYIVVNDSNYIRGYQLGLFIHFQKNNIYAVSNGKKLFYRLNNRILIP